MSAPLIVGAVLVLLAIVIIARTVNIIQQGYVEASNVDPVTEITNLISAQRAYEMNSKVIQAADQMSGTISNMRS